MSIDRTPWATPAGEDVMSALDACVIEPDAEHVAAARQALVLADAWPEPRPWQVAEPIRAARTAVESYDRHVGGAR